MNVEIGAEAMQFPEKEYIDVISFAVHIILDHQVSTMHVHGIMY